MPPQACNVFPDDGHDRLGAHPDDEAEQAHAFCPTPPAAVGKATISATSFAGSDGGGTSLALGLPKQHRRWSRTLRHFSSVRHMSILFDDARLSTRPHGRWTIGLWLSVVLHAIVVVVLIDTPIRSSENPPAPGKRSTLVFNMPATALVKSPPAPFVAPRIPAPPAPPVAMR